MTNSKYSRILAIATTVCLFLLGIMFIVCTAHLYFTGGEEPYSRERVGEYLIILAIPSAITLALIIGGIVLAVIEGQKDDFTTPRTNIELLESFSKRYDLASFDGETKAQIIKERKNRSVFKYISYSFSAMVFALVLAYMFFAAEFTVETLNADVIAAMTVALPLSVIALGIHLPRVYVAETSAKRELDLMKAYIKKNGAPQPTKSESANNDKVNYTVIARYVILGVAVVFVILGIFNGGMVDVLQKAVKICTECIGLG